MMFLSHISNFDANTGLLNIGGEPAFIDALLDLALDFSAHSLGSLFCRAFEMEELQQQISKIYFVQLYSLYSIADHRWQTTTSQALRNHETHMKILAFLLVLKYSRSLLFS